MSLADHIFIDMCRDILEHGVSTEGEKVRPHWEDGTSAYTIKKFCGMRHSSQRCRNRMGRVFRIRIF